MKKLWNKHAMKNKKKESGSKKRGSNSLASKAPAKRRRIVGAICRDEHSKLEGCQYCATSKDKLKSYLHITGTLMRMVEPSTGSGVVVPLCMQISPLPRRAVIALAYWKITIGNLTGGATRWYRIGLLEYCHYHLPGLCNALAANLVYCITKMALTLHPSIGFGCYLNIPLSNYIGKITKCLLKLEIEQPNQEEIHVFFKGQILRFSIYKFALITGLNNFGNVDDFKYEKFSPSRLMRRYFPQSTNVVDKEALVDLKENFENKEDSLHMIILYFIHTFIYSQLNASPISFSYFIMVEDGKYEFFPWGKVSFSRLMASLRQEYFVDKQLYRLGGIPQELEKLDLPPISFASDHPGTSLMPSSTGNPNKRSYQVNLPQVSTDHDSFDDFSMTPPHFFMKESIHVSGTVSAPLSKMEKMFLLVNPTDAEQMSKEVDDYTCTNRKEVLVKEDLDSLKSNIKTYVKTYIDMKFNDLEHAMNDRFSELLMSLQSKNKNMEKEHVTKQSLKGDQSSEDAVVFEGHSNPISPYFVMEKIEEMKDDEIEKQSEIVVEEMESIDKIFPVPEPDMTLIIYKPPTKTPDEHLISETEILSAFPTPKKIVSEVKKILAKWNNKPLMIYRSPFWTHFGSSSKGKKKLASIEQKKDSSNVEIKVFEEWIKEGLYMQNMKKEDVDVIMYYLRKKYKKKNFSINRYTTTDFFFKVYTDKAYVNYYEDDVGKDLTTQDASAKIDEVIDMEMSLINTIKGMSSRAGQPWHLVNEVFIPINCYGAFHWVLAVITLRYRCIRVYDSIASSWKRTKTSEIEELAGKTERDPFQVEYISEIAQQDFESLNCGVFVAVYAEYLSEGLGIPSSGVDA
ncbi:hypothetical protein FXO37_36403 [Capsicum annuum]|nr:hypothetical protein FXO37_36403 [Capsicum annuum]